MSSKLTKTIAAFLMLPALSAYAQAPAFPGAEGFARYTTKGGRGQTVVHVTNLNDSGTGSLRSAVSSSNRIVVFDVSGYINLASDLTIKDNITIAGQTAPGDGITVRYRTLRPGSNNIIRFIRFRRSQVTDVNDGADCTWQRNKNNIIFDHCSFSWSIDELASFYDNNNFTMQWCTLGEALANPGHSKGEHSYGGIWGGKGASFHHNFICHAQNRTPRFNGARYQWSGFLNPGGIYDNTVQAERVDFRNCVMYNWGTGGCYGGPGGGYVNMVNNYYKAGPGTLFKTQVTQVSVASSGNAKENPECWGIASRYFINGNYVAAAGDRAANYDWKGVIYDDGLASLNGEKYIIDPTHLYGSKVNYVKISGSDCVSVRLDEPIDAGDVTTHSAENAFEKVLEYCGASLVRDAVDARYMEEARTGTVTYYNTTHGRAGIVDKVNSPTATVDTKLPSFPDLKSEKRPAGFDSDGDGMPDEWEILNGLNPKSSTDGKTYTLDSKKYYTNVEVYLNSLVEHIIKAENADAEDGVEEWYPACKTAADAVVADTPSAQAVRYEYYDLSGGKLAQPIPGVNIRKQVFSDGTIVTDKVLLK